MVMSHPSWVRGLKLLKVRLIEPSLKSHPSWVRGLKQTQSAYNQAQMFVAPLVGAWIETLLLRLGKSEIS